MPNSKNSEKGARPGGEPLSSEVEAMRQFEQATASARLQLEEYIATWIRDLAAAREALSQEIGAGGEGRISEAGGRLDRLGEMMRRAPFGQPSAFADSFCSAKPNI